MTRQALPYIALPDGDAHLGEWQVHRQGEWWGDIRELDDWAPGTDIRMRREITASAADIRAVTQLPADVPLKVVTSWTNSVTNMIGRAGVTHLDHPAVATHEILLPGSRVGGTVTLRTTFVAGRDCDPRPGVAHLAGSVLYADNYRLALEGAAALFPVAVVDFAHTTYDLDASWFLTTSPELEAPFMGRFQLEVNSRDTELVSAIAAEKPTDRQKTLLTEMQHQLAMLLLEFAQGCNQEAELTEGDWLPDTVGDALKRILISSGEDGRSSPLVILDLAQRRADREGITRRSGHGRPFK